MNERIKEIVKQAGVFYSYQDQVWELTNGDLEKFAELILQDVCARLEPELAEEILAHYGLTNA